jgi:hypothetical protein
MVPSQCPDSVAYACPPYATKTSCRHHTKKDLVALTPKRRVYDHRINFPIDTSFCHLIFQGMYLLQVIKFSCIYYELLK